MSENVWDYENVSLEPVAQVAGKLRTDWSKEEQKFRDGLAAFRAAMPVLENPLYEYKQDVPVLDAKKVAPEVVAPKEIERNAEKNSKIQEGRADPSVELANVRGKVTSALQPAQPTQPESKVEEDDIFDLEPKSPPKKEQTSPKKEDLDFFDALEPAKAEPPKAETPSSPAAVPVPVPESKTFSSPGIAASVPETSTSSSPGIVSTFVCPAVAEMSHSTHTEKDAEMLFLTDSSFEEGFDAARFESIKRVARMMLKGCPDIDLDVIERECRDYSVDLRTDYHREDTDYVLEKMLAVQAKKDALHAHNLRLIPLYQSMKSAAEFITTVGPCCSAASNRDNRLAAVKMAIPNFWVRHAKVCRVKEQVDKSSEHLVQQYDTVSRVVTAEQLRLKRQEISRGAHAFDPIASSPPWATTPSAGAELPTASCPTVLTPDRSAEPQVAPQATVPFVPPQPKRQPQPTGNLEDFNPVPSRDGCNHGSSEVDF